MGRKWGKVDYRELEQLRDRLQKFQKVDMDKFCTRMAKNLAQRLLRRVVYRTPTGETPTYISPKIKAAYWNGYSGGTLKKAWKISPVVYRGGEYRIHVYNDRPYASYVEYGHRQRTGRYVPQLGMQLKSGWVEGKFMLKISEEQVQNLAPALLQKELEKELRKIFNA